MKKLFLSTLSIFALCLMFSLNYQSNVIVGNDAFAEGVCCPEVNSICCHQGSCSSNHYYKASGSCKPTPVIEEFD